MRHLTCLVLLVATVLANATPIDPSQFTNFGEFDAATGTYTLNGQTSPVESLYLDDFWIGPGIQSLTFDMLFHWDEDFVDYATNILTFRMFTDAMWEDQWLTFSPNDLWMAYEPDFGDITAHVTIDLTAYQNSVVDMGWSFIADGWELSYAEISNINLIPEPPTIALILAVLVGLVFSRRLQRAR